MTATLVFCDARAPGSGDPCVLLSHPEQPDAHDGRYWLYENGVAFDEDDAV